MREVQEEKRAEAAAAQGGGGGGGGSPAGFKKGHTIMDRAKFLKRSSNNLGRMKPSPSY